MKTFKNPDSGHIAHWIRAADSPSLRRRRFKIFCKRFVWRLVVGVSTALKRALDFAVSSIALFLGFPIFLIVAIMIKIEDGGPIFYRQERIGRRGQPFGLWKFRSMIVNAHQLREAMEVANQHGEENITFKNRRDPRITRTGRFLRRFSIDEAPQFLNVFKGDMSVVGPRPPIRSEVEDYKAFHLRRLMIKPGLTGLWQVTGRAEIDFEGMVRLDLEYMRSESLWKDLKILLLTIPAVITGRGAY
jgi:lipopolysaccharide/colanic/teichoic acid biosynthesis glycosyltransferase